MYTRQPLLSNVIDARLFPYFADPNRIAFSRYGVDAYTVIQRYPDILRRGFERLRLAVRKLIVPRPADSVEAEVLGFYAAGLLASYSGNRWLVSRLALAEASRAQRLLEELPDEVVALVGRLAGIASMRFSPRAYAEPIAVIGITPLYRVYGYSVKFLDYIEYGRRLLGDDTWKPSNLPVRKGIVYLDKHRAVRLIKEALTAYIEERIHELQGSVEGNVVLPDDIVNEVRRLAADATRPRKCASGGRIEVPQGVIVEEAFPPCMSDILIRARRGEHLSHHERFAIATFLLNIGAEIDYVVDVFRNMPDFNEKITRYQVEHLAGLRGSGKKYATYSCEKMKSLGLCRAECGTRTPIQAYYRALRRISRNSSKASSKELSKTASSVERGAQSPNS